MFKLEIDPDYENKLGKAGKALNKAIVWTLTDAATFAKEEFIKEVKAKVDRPSSFTVSPSGYGIIFAKFGDPKPFSDFLIKNKQAGYMQYLIGMNLVRGVGDPGASQRHVWVPGQRPDFSFPTGVYSVTPRLNALGSLPQHYEETLYDQWRAQQKTLKGRDGPGAYGNGGVFFGTVKGRTGFWARPKRVRTVKGAEQRKFEKQIGHSLALHQRGADGRFVATGRADLSRTKTTKRGGTVTTNDLRSRNLGIPILLAKTGPFNDGGDYTRHHEIIDYAAAMERGRARSYAMFEQRFHKYMASA